MFHFSRILCSWPPLLPAADVSVFLETFIPKLGPRFFVLVREFRRSIRSAPFFVAFTRVGQEGDDVLPFKRSEV